MHKIRISRLLNRKYSADDPSLTQYPGYTEHRDLSAPREIAQFRASNNSFITTYHSTIILESLAPV